METHQISTLYSRAAIRPSSINEEDRTFEIIISTGAEGRRGGLFTAPFLESLSMEPGHIRLGRLNNKAPLLNSHMAYDVLRQLGVIEKAFERCWFGLCGQSLIRWPTVHFSGFCSGGW